MTVFADLVAPSDEPYDEVPPRPDQDLDLEDLSSFDPIDLGPAWRGEKVRPVADVFERDDGIPLLLPGLNYLHGDSGDGKSMVAAVAAAIEIGFGRDVIWVSYEDANEDLVVERLKMLGATEAQKDLVRFITPDVGLTYGAAKLGELARSSGARLMVLDSVGEAMGVGGVNEDSDHEVTPWFQQTTRVISQWAPDLAILPIDHGTKSKDNPLFPSGSKRKRSAPTGRCYLLNVSKSLGVGHIGYVQLVVAKDRGGTFARGDIAAEIMLDATELPYRWTIKPPRDGDTYAPKVKRRNSEDRVLEVLELSTVELNATEVCRLVNAPDRRRQEEAELSPQTVRNALTKAAKRVGVAMSGGQKDDTGQFVPAKWHITHPDQDDVSP